jgi:hypothetical protein
MQQFIIQSQFNSRDDSTISGSLTTNTLIQSSVIGTASYADTSSYTDNSLTSSYTTTSQTLSSSYSINSISSSIAYTASIVTDLGVGVNSTISFLNPNVYFGQYTTGHTKGSNTGLLVGGALFSPIRIQKTCTCASMSAIFFGTVNSSSCFVALYTNGTSSNLPEYRIIHGETSKSTSTTVYNNYFTSQSTPVTLYKDEIYWVAMSLSGASAATTIPSSGGEGNFNYGFNPVLGTRFISPAGLQNWNSVGYQILRSGSTNLTTDNYTLPLTCSQDIAQYNTGSSISGVPVSIYNILMPSLKIQY